MNNNIKKVVTAGLVGFIVGTTLTVSAGTWIQAYRNDELKVSLDGKIQTFRDATTNEIEVPITYNDRTYLPLRSLATLVGLNVDYDVNTKTAILETKDNNILDNVDNQNQAENVTIKVLNEEKKNILKNSKKPNYSQNKKLEFFTLKPLEEKVVNLNGKEITLDMQIGKYSMNKGEGSLVNYFSYDYYVDMIDYTVTEGNSINGRYYDYVGFFRGQGIKNNYVADITEINIEKAIKDIGIKIGVLKDSITGKDYLVCYVEEADFCTDVFYIYDDEGNLVYKGNYDWYFGNAIPTDNKGEYKQVDAIEFYENKIICYDMYMNFEDGEKINIEREIVELEDNSTNKVHKLTIENGIVKDKIIKIYEGIPVGQI